jgi:hypothetical protein
VDCGIGGNKMLIVQNLLERIAICTTSKRTFRH